MIDVFNREALEKRFGGWPAFHDAEVQALRLDSGQRSDGKPSVELDVHLVEASQQSAGSLEFAGHTLVTLRFEGAEAIELDGFGPQNVLFDLAFEDLGAGAPGPARMLVSLRSSNGLGGHFRCEQAVVVKVEDFQPGQHSVYFGISSAY